MIHHTMCSLCEAMCGLDVEVEGTAVRSIRGDAADPFSQGYMCPKGVALQDLYEDPDRILRPLRRRGRDFEEISWDAALDEAADRLGAIRKRHGNDAVGLYVGNPSAHNSEVLLVGTLLIAALSTRNRYSASSVDQLPHMFAALHMYGHQLLMAVPDLERTKHLVILGANPLASNGSLMTAPDVRRRLLAIRERGGKVVVLDPRRTETAAIADEHHPLRPGSDAALLAAMAATLFEEGLVRDGRWRAFTDGVEDVRRAVAPFAPERVAWHAGIDGSTIRRLTRELAAAEGSALYGRMGVCTQEFGGLGAWLLNVVNLLTGNLDRPGGMMFTTPAADLVALLARIGQTGTAGTYRSRVSDLPEFGGELPAAALAEEITTPGERQVRGLITMCGNPVLSTPNGRRLDAALAELEHMVSIDIYLNETTRHAHLILPGVTPLERAHYSMLGLAAVRNVAKLTSPVLPLRGGRDEWQIALELTERLQRRAGGAGRLAALGTRAVRALGPRRVLDLLLRTGPQRGRGLSVAHLERNPHGLDLGPLEADRLPARLFTPGKRIRLAPEVCVADLTRLTAAIDERAADTTDAALLLIGRRQLRGNNSWMHNSRRLTKGKDRCTLLIHPEDAAARGLAAGDRATIASRVGAIEAPVELDDGMMRGVVSLPHGFGHRRDGVRLSVASQEAGPSFNDVADHAHVDRLTGTSGLSGIPVAVTKIAEPSRAA